MYNQTYVFDLYCYKDLRAQESTTDCSLRQFKGLVRETFLYDLVAYRNASSQILETAIRRAIGSDKGIVDDEVSIGSMLMKIVGRVTSINPALNIHTVARASRAERAQSFTLMLAMMPPRGYCETSFKYQLGSFAGST
eukprot:3278318-Amphidinium_carterae.2